MKISIQKFSGKSPVITCTRDNGSITWQSYGNQGKFFPLHDLTHFVLETELEYRNAFFGMIASGRDLNDFGSGDAATFHPEAVHAEMLAGLLSAVGGNGSNLSYEAIKETIDIKSQEAGIPPMVLTEKQFGSIRQQTQKLIDEWNRLPQEDALVLTFIIR